jgi:Skp family chaperone for outer membrane proteins
LRYFTFLFIFLFNTNIYALNVATVDLDIILNNSTSYKVFINKLNDFIDSETSKFENNEIILNKNKEDIESKQSIINESEFNILISNYNEQLTKFQNNINNFNSFIDDNIETNKNIMIDKIIEILKEISIQDNYDFIFTNSNYLLAQNKFDISNQVIIKLNNYKILLNINNIN